MTILSRVIGRLRSELNALFGPDSRPWVRSTSRGKAGSASAEHEPRAGRRPRRSNTGAGPAADPVLARYYANLELPYGAGLDTVSGAWRRLVKEYHPDLHSADEQKKRTATELVKGLNRAYEELSKHLKHT